MLDGLDKIDWKSLHHAYGSAADVPGNLRGLLSFVPAIREESLSNLEFSIFHQGSVYEATVPAVRFLVELSMNPDVRNREALLYLLADIATGNGWFTNHQSLSVIRQVYSEQIIELNQQKEARHVSELREELARHAEPLSGLVATEDSKVRLAATHLMALLPNSSDHAYRALVSRITVEREDNIRANILKSLMRLDREQACRIAQCVDVEDSERLTRLAVWAVVVSSGDAADQSRVMPELIHGVLNSDADLIRSYNFLPSVDDFFLELAVPVAIRNKGVSEQVVGKILKFQLESNHPKMISDFRAIALLLCALYPGGNRHEIGDLEHWQNAAIWQVARCAWPEWNIYSCNLIDILARFGLPNSLQELAAAMGHSTHRFGWRRAVDRTYRDDSWKSSPWWKFW